MFSRLALFACLATAALVAAPLSATSIVTPAPHSVGRSCQSIAALIEGINAGQLAAIESRFAGPQFTSKKFGFVDWEEREAFLTSLTSSEGKPDDKPMRLDRVYELDADKSSALWLVRLVRSVWRSQRWVPTGMLTEELIDDPHRALDAGYWLVSLRSGRVSEMIELDIGYRLARSAKRIDCEDPKSWPKDDPLFGAAPLQVIGEEQVTKALPKDEREQEEEK